MSAARCGRRRYRRRRDPRPPDLPVSDHLTHPAYPTYPTYPPRQPYYCAVDVLACGCSVSFCTRQFRSSAT